MVSTEPSSRNTLVWSTLDNHKIVPQATAGGTYAMGIAAAIPLLPKAFNYSVVFTANAGEDKTLPHRHSVNSRILIWWCRDSPHKQGFTAPPPSVFPPGGSVARLAASFIC